MATTCSGWSKAGWFGLGAGAMVGLISLGKAMDRAGQNTATSRQHLEWERRGREMFSGSRRRRSLLAWRI